MGIALNGLGTKLTKLGKIFDQHSQMDVSDKEYWPWPVLGSEVDGWPSERYPMLFYTSTDHGELGGIYLRVWDRNLGDLTKIVDGVEVANPDAVVEWQDISSRPEFDHITKKTNPIFVDSGNGSQTETPSVIRANGQLYMYYHNNAVDLTGYGKGASGKTYQSTKYAIGTNGVDFSGNFISTLWYDAYQVEGDGHNGYFVPTVNVIEEIPYTYIGRALHGGGGLERGSTSAFYGSNDCENWYRIDVASSAYGILEEGPDLASGRILNVGVVNLKKEGAYYRAKAHNRLRVSGGTSTNGVISEVLINGDLNIVSHCRTIAPRGDSSSVDGEAVGSSQKEITFEGRTYGFYKAISSSGVHSQAMYVVEDEPYTWDVFEPLSQKETLFETRTTLDNVAPNLTYSHAAFFKDKTVSGHIENEYLTFIPIPVNGTPSTVVSTFEVDLSSKDVVDVLFEKIGKNWGDPQILEFGLIDDLNSPTSKIAYYFPAGSGNANQLSEPMQISVLGAADESNRVTKNYFGQGSNWTSNSYVEAPSSKHNVGLRVIPSENRIVTLEGRSLNDVFDISGFDFTKPLKVFIKVQAIPTHPNERQASFKGITVNAYSRNAIAVPAAPTLTTNKTSTSVTLSTNSVSGATGYKYFLNGIEQTDGNFTGLEPETEYTVYARSVNALGDSAPSTIQTVTTDSAGTPDTTPPVVTNNGPSTVTIYVGDSYTPNFSTNEGTLSIDNPVDTSTAGTYTVTATATDAAGNVGSATQTVIVTEEANVPPTANAGPDQSVAAGVEFILDGSASQDTDGTIVEYRWTQISGDPVILDISTPSQPKATSPSRTSAQTLTFQLITVDDEGEESAPGTVNVNVAAVVLSEILKVIERLDFDLVTQGDVNAYFGRANREVMKLKPSDPTGLALDANGFMMLDSNTIEEVKVIAEGSSISSKTDSINLDGSEMLVRLGDLEASKNGNIYFSIVVFVEGDTKGVVVSSKGSSGNKPMSYVTL